MTGLLCLCTVHWICFHIGIARILSGDALFLRQKSDDLSLVITLFYIAIYVLYCHQLPILSRLWQCTSLNSAPFSPHSNKNAYKKIFHRPGECTPMCLHLFAGLLVFVLIYYRKAAFSVIETYFLDLYCSGTLQPIVVLCLVIR